MTPLEKWLFAAPVLTLVAIKVFNAGRRLARK